MKLILLAALCCYVAVEVYAKPRGPPPRPKGPPPHVKRLVRLCQGLSDGNITNSDTAYGNVFVTLEPVCVDVLAVAAEREKPADKASKGGPRGRRGPPPKRPEPEDGADAEKPNAVKAIQGICKRLARKPASNPNADNPFSDILTQMEPICAEVDSIVGALPE